MPPKELLDFRADLVKLLIRRSRYRKRSVVPQSSSHSRDGVSKWLFPLPSWRSWNIERKVLPLGRRPVHHTPLPALFVKFVSARFSVLLSITRTELYVVLWRSTNQNITLLYMWFLSLSIFTELLLFK